MHTHRLPPLGVPQHDQALQQVPHLVVRLLLRLFSLALAEAATAAATAAAAVVAAAAASIAAAAAASLPVALPAATAAAAAWCQKGKEGGALCPSSRALARVIVGCSARAPDSKPTHKVVIIAQ